MPLIRFDNGVYYVASYDDFVVPSAMGFVLRVAWYLSLHSYNLKISGRIEVWGVCFLLPTVYLLFHDFHIFVLRVAWYLSLHSYNL
jgi:hypothetical protein